MSDMAVRKAAVTALEYDLYLGEQSVCVSTSLEGPGSGKNTESEIGAGTVSYPYIVIKLETLDAPVIFDI